jgi:exodeoxyribonuclease VII large subunit
MTPTAAAVQIADGWSAARQMVAGLAEDLQAAAEDHTRVCKHALDRAMRAYLAQAPAMRLQRARARIGHAEQRLLHAGSRGSQEARRTAIAAATRLERHGPLRQVERTRTLLDGLQARLEAANPLGLLERGYAVVRKADSDTYLRSASEAAAGELLHIRLAEGELDARVE